MTGPVNAMYKTNIALRGWIVWVGLILLAGSVKADPLDFTYDSLPAQRLGSYNVDLAQSSVSGLSAGAYMADQFFVAFSEDMLGCGLFAGGPYGCSQGSLFIAAGRCMKPPLLFNTLDDNALEHFLTQAGRYADQGKIDDLANLRTKKIYIYSGKKDATVKPEVTDWVDNWYALAGVPHANIQYKNDLEAPHALPTLDYGNIPCTRPGNPWINDCDYDGAGEALTHILGPLHPRRPTAQLSGQFIKYRQNDFFQPANLAPEQLKNQFSMNEFGFAYVPRACTDGQPCRIHVAFHGCKQVYNRNPEAGDFSTEDATPPFGLQFVKYAGYNEWADTNNLIVLYPQAQKVPTINPRGCFDWWGYLPGTSDTYATQEGPQMKAVYAMMTRLAQGAQAACQGGTRPPAITLAGPDSIQIDIGETPVLPQPEAMAADPEEGDLSGAITRTPSGPIDTSRPATLRLKYNVADSQGCKATEVVRTIVVGGCDQWTAANHQHAEEGRAYSRWCLRYFFFPYKCYYAKGSKNPLGPGSAQTTLRRNDGESDFYNKGKCP